MPFNYCHLFPLGDQLLLLVIPFKNASGVGVWQLHLYKNIFAPAASATYPGNQTSSHLNTPSSAECLDMVAISKDQRPWLEMALLLDLTSTSPYLIGPFEFSIAVVITPRPNGHSNSNRVSR